MNFFTKIIRADDARKTRFHDQQGGLIPISDLTLLPLRLAETLGTKFGVYPTKPWWPRSAKLSIEKIAMPHSTAIEFGSGMSTAWLARKFYHVMSIEHDEEWYERVSTNFGNKVSNVDLVLRSKDGYLDIYIEAPIDFVLIDGLRRKDCLLWAVKNVKVGGYIYLDNSDCDKNGDSEGSRAEIIRLRDMGILEVNFYRGIPPGLFQVTEGALARRLR